MIETVAPMNGVSQQNTAPKPQSKVEVLKNIMKAPSIQEQFNNVLKENSGVFVASIIDLYNGDSYLQNCDPKNVVMEALKAAVLKLPINKSLGFAYLVPFNESYKDDKGQWQKRQMPQMQIGYKGLIQLAMRTGQYRIINADKVFEGEFKTKNKLTGEFDLSGAKTSDNIVGYFSHIEMLNGFSKTLYMTKEEVAAHARKYSKSFNTDKSPWKTEFDAMSIKTVLRNLLSHYGFLSVEMATAMNNDIESDNLDNNVRQEIQDNGNKQSIGFEEVEVINDNQGNQEDNNQPNGKAPF